MSDQADQPTRSAYALLCDMDRQWRQMGAVAASGARVWSGLGVRIGEHRIAVPRDDLSEVIPKPTLTRIPHAAPWVHGIANHRGALLPVFDLAGVLGLGEHAREQLPRAWVLVLNTPDTPVGFAVDEVFGHREFTTADQRPALRDGIDTTVDDSLLGVFVREGEQWAAFGLRKLLGDGLLRATSATSAREVAA